MRMLFRRYSALVILLPSASLATGQVATGSYPFGTYDQKGIDTINLGNLNAHLSIPLLNKPGRGLPFYYNLSYDSSVWYPTLVNGSTVWEPVPNFGWRGDTEITTGYVSFNESTSDSRVLGSGGIYYTCPTTYYTDFVYHDPYGVPHPLIGLTMNTSQQPPECNPPASAPSFSATATDASGYSISVVNFDVSTLTTRTGAKFGAPNGPSGAGVVTDSNGNEITANGTGSFTDTLGKNVLTVAGGGSTTQTFTYTDTNGNPQIVDVNYTQKTVETDFGCGGVGEYGPTAAYLVTSIVFPDGDTYSFQYEQTPNGPSGNVTGRIIKVTLPQGGVITYGYSNGLTGTGGTTGSNGIMCADGSTSGLTRSIAASAGSAASTWTYLRATGQIDGPLSSETQVTDGLNNVSVYGFIEATNQPVGTTAEYYEISRSQYQGAATGTALLARSTCYNESIPPTASACTSPSLTTPISQVDAYQTLNGSEENGSTTTYDAYGDQTNEYDYEYGTGGSRGATLRREAWQYNAGIVGLPTEDDVYDGSGSHAGEVMLTYDGGTLTATSGLPQHVSVSGSRGNLTQEIVDTAPSVSVWWNATYEDTGDMLTSATQNGQTSFAYDPTHAYLTTLTPPTPSSGVALPSYATYDANTGVTLNSTDPNSAQTLYSSYDSMLRPTQVNYPDGGKTVLSYPNALQTGIDQYQNASAFADTQVLLDSYARESRVAVANGQSSDPWYQQDVCYDANGNTDFTPYRYQGTGWGTSKVCSGSGDSYAYDALGRVTSIVHADGTSIQYSYNGRATETTDEYGVQRISQVDGLGRITSLCEVSSEIGMPGGSGSPANCDLDIAGTGFLTTYAYSLANHTTTITQGQQTRAFQTDWIGRPISVTEPESGTTTYSYGYNSTGLVVTRVRPKANQTNPGTTTTTTTQYDAVGRVLSVSYSDGTPTKTFAWDASAGWGATQTNLKGRLSHTSIPAFGSSAQTIYSYDSMGRVSLTGQCFPYNCATPTDYKYINNTYDETGNILSESDPTIGTLTYQYSVAGELTSMAGTYSPDSLISSVQNGPFGPLTWSLGNGLTAVRSYDGQGRPNGGYVCQGSSQPSCAGGTQLYGFVASWRGEYLLNTCDTEINQCDSYGYDQFGRLNALNVTQGAGTNYGYVYDRWGNRWQQNPASGGWSSQLSFNSANNQISTGGFQYDAAGNLTSDGGFHNYTYDAEGNLISVDSGSTAAYTYDAQGRRVRIQATGISTYDQTFDFLNRRVTEWQESDDFGIHGAEYWGSSATPTSFRYVDGNTYFEHQDWMGTERLNTTYQGTVSGGFSSLPFGDGYTVSGSDDDRYHFATLDHDSESDTDHAQFRQYSNATGRWMSPDPYSGSYDPADPQSMNRYIYVLNNPLTLVDPVGLDCDDVQLQSALDTQYDPDGNVIQKIWEDEYEEVCTDNGGGGGGVPGPFCTRRNETNWFKKERRWHEGRSTHLSRW